MFRDDTRNTNLMFLLYLAVVPLAPETAMLTYHQFYGPRSLKSKSIYLTDVLYLNEISSQANKYGNKHCHFRILLRLDHEWIFRISAIAL